MTDRDFLNWIADRLVHRYGESESVDFVLRLRRIANKCRRCGIGVDDDGDGDCVVCHVLTDEEVDAIKRGVARAAECHAKEQRA